MILTIAYMMKMTMFPDFYWQGKYVQNDDYSINMLHNAWWLSHDVLMLLDMMMNEPSLMHDVFSMIFQWMMMCLYFTKTWLLSLKVMARLMATTQTQAVLILAQTQTKDLSGNVKLWDGPC